MSTTAIPDEASREALAQEGVEIIEKTVELLDLPHIVSQMKDLEQYNQEVAEKMPLGSLSVLPEITFCQEPMSLDKQAYLNKKFATKGLHKSC